jgi:hypothetical protein
MHTLRHCFATDRLEQKTDIRVIQVLLRHRHLETTTIDTHVATDLLRALQGGFNRSTERAGCVMAINLGLHWRRWAPRSTECRPTVGRLAPLSNDAMRPWMARFCRCAA